MDYHKQITYEGLLPRDIIVWLPPGYDENKDKKYPVLYMHDGQNLFDPKTSFTKIDWQIDEAADSLIKNDIIDPFIIVGIYNTKDRNEEYIDTPLGIKYMQFIITKLKPFIDSTYRTLPDRSNTATGGSSSGGLISFMIAWNYSSYFSQAACFSPAFKFNNFDYTEKVKSYSGTKKDVKFYIDNGGIGLEKKLQPGVDKMVDELKEKDFILDENLFVIIDSTAEHNEAAWALRVPVMLESFYKKGSTKISVVQELSVIKDSPKVAQPKRNILDKRFRVQLSTVSTLSQDNFQISLPLFLDLNYRFSNQDSLKLQKNVAFSFSTQPGMNLFFDDFMILPYFKIGPELRLFKKIYWDAHIGVSFLFFSLNTPIPFYGSELGYIFNQSKDFSIELELGFNGISNYYIYYFSFIYSF